MVCCFVTLLLLQLFCPHFPAAPDPPTALDVADVDKDSVTLNWKKPKNDGGQRVQGYVVEYKPVDGGKWKKANDVPVKDTSFTGMSRVFIFVTSSFFYFRRDPASSTDFVETQSSLLKFHPPSPIEILPKVPSIFPP